jgi:Probable Zinc-ribbon domain
MVTGESLAQSNPQLATEWHPTVNRGLFPESVKPNSTKVAWWKYAKGHVWDTHVNKRAKEGYGCPYCVGQRVLEADSLAARFPLIAAEWHTTKNLPLKPTQVRPGSARRVIWLCKKDQSHTWETEIVARTSGGSGCPSCSGRYRTPQSSFAGRFPEIAALWHPTKNCDRKPEEFAANSRFQAWWQCDRDPNHVWTSKIRSRTQHQRIRCPICAHCREYMNANDIGVSGVYFSLRKGNFAQLLVLLLPARLERPGEDLLKMVAVIYRGVKKHNVGVVFRSA